MLYKQNQYCAQAADHQNNAPTRHGTKVQRVEPKREESDQRHGNIRGGVGPGGHSSAAFLGQNLGQETIGDGIECAYANAGEEAADHQHPGIDRECA